MGVRECPLKTDWALFGFRLSECNLQFVFALKTNSLRILLSLEYHNFFGYSRKKPVDYYVSSKKEIKLITR